MNPNEILDEVLKFIYRIPGLNLQHNQTGFDLEDIYRELNKAILKQNQKFARTLEELALPKTIQIATMQSILEKLAKDGYLKQDKNNQHRFHITFEGHWFINNPNGGYINQERTKANTNKIRNLERILLTFGAVAAGVYGLFEIGKWALNGFHYMFSIQIMTAVFLFSSGLLSGLIIYQLIRHQLEQKE